MSGEGNLRIGATVDTGELNEGFTSVQDLTQKVTQKLAVSFEECSTRTKAAMRNLSDDVKAAAESVSAESLKIAEATKAQTAALGDLRRAQTIARDANVDSAASTAILAAAQEKAAAASEELAAARKAEAATTVVAAEAVGESSNFIIAGFQRAGAAVSESLAGMRERLVLTGETAHITARDMTSAFSGLGELLGVGLLAGFAGNYLDDLAKMQVELGHLRVETGLSVTSLAGLQEIVKEMGSEWEPIERGLVHLNRSMAEAQEGMAEYKRAFSDIGITMEELKGKTPEEKLNLVSAAFAHTDNTARVADAALTLFGRGGIGLIPVLKAQGDQLDANMKKMGDLTGITDKTVEASERWQQDTARLSAEFRSVMMPVLEHAGDVISGVAGAFEAAAFVIVGGFELIATAVVSAGQAVYGFGKLLFDATTGNFTAIAGDVTQLRDRVVDTWKAGFADIESGWKEVASRFKDPGPEPLPPQGVDPGDLEPPEKKKKGAGNAAFRADEDQLNQLKLDHQLTLEEEIRFWQQKLATAKKGSEEYREIMARLANLTQQEDRKKKPMLETSEDNSGLKAAEDAFIKSQNDEAKAASEAAKQEIEAYREAREEEIRLAAEHYQDVERDSEFEVQMGRMTQAQRITALRQAAAQEQQIRMQAIHAMEMVDMQNVQRYQQDLNRELQATRQFATEIAKLNEQAALRVQNDWNKAFQKLNTDILQLTNDWMRGTRNMEQQFAKMFNDILMSLANFVEKWLLKKAEMWAEEKIMQITGLGAQHAAQTTSNVATVTGDAGVAAAGTMAYYAAIDPPIAPAMAAVSFAETMAFASMAAFEKGGIVGGSPGMAVPILAHAGERVLTSQQTQNFESMVNNSNSNSRSVTQHLHYEPKINAYDRSGMRSTLNSHASDILDIVRQGYRDGALA